MKICLIGEYTKANWSGSATNKVQKYLAAALVSSGHKVTIFELPLIKGKFKKLFFTEKSFIENDIEIMQAGALKVIPLLLWNDFDVIHFIVTRKYMLITLPILFFTNAKVFSTFHDTLIFSSQKKSIGRYMEYFLYRSLIYFSNKIFVYSETDFKMIKKYSKNKSALMKNGVDSDFFSPSYEKNSEKIIVFAGGLGKNYKGLKYLEDTLKLVKQEFSFKLCGENPTNLTYPNYDGPLEQEKFRTVLQKAHMLIVPSEYEPFSINGLEAMACGTPIIITKNCGLAKYLTDGEGCFVVEYGNTRQLNSRISQLLSDKTLHKEMSVKAREFAEKFDWQKIIIEYLYQYKN